MKECNRKDCYWFFEKGEQNCFLSNDVSGECLKDGLCEYFGKDTKKKNTMRKVKLTDNPDSIIQFYIENNQKRARIKSSNSDEKKFIFTQDAINAVLENLDELRKFAKGEYDIDIVELGAGEMLEI